MLREKTDTNFTGDLSVTLVYTSMCGTCEMAKRMLSVISESMKDIAFYQMNANLYPDVINAYDISSVPCFLIFKRGVLVDQFYAFHSVSFLYERINGFRKK